MPVYEYRCEDCRERFEMRRSFAESSAPAGCPVCKSDHTHRLLSSFYAVTTSSDGGTTTAVAGGGGCAGCAGGSCASCGH